MHMNSFNAKEITIVDDVPNNLQTTLQGFQFLFLLPLELHKLQQYLHHQQQPP